MIIDLLDIGTRLKTRLNRTQTPDNSVLSDTEARGYEKRRSPRVEVETLLTAITRDGFRYNGYCRDLSREGSSALVWGELKPGEELCLAYRTPGDKEVIMIPAIVRYAVNNRYGFEFSVADPIELQGLLVKTCRAFATYS